MADLGLVSRNHFTDAEMNTLVDPLDTFVEKPVPLKRVLERMRKTYTSHIGVEFGQIYNSDRRRWLMHRMEHSENTTQLAGDQLPQARGWPLPSAVWKLEPQAHDLVALGLKIEKPLFMMSST